MLEALLNLINTLLSKNMTLNCDFKYPNLVFYSLNARSEKNSGNMGSDFCTTFKYVNMRIAT